MQIQSMTYLLFFFLVCLFYYVIPLKLRRPWLLAVSWAFYLTVASRLAYYLAGITLLSYCLGLMLEKKRKTVSAGTALALSLAVTFAALAVVKYGGFILGNVNWTLKALGAGFGIKVPQILQPVGLSFFTFAAAGYLMDVFRGAREAERNFLSYALFLSFFPTIMAGPIERSTNLLRQIDEIHLIRLDTAKVRHGLLTMLYGYFLKIMLADRLSILVNTAFAKYASYGGTVLCLALIAFSIQLYCDFAGISTIALGAGEVMGFSLIQNFETPYFSMSVAEFWRRWHISLSYWFRDYLYFPLGGNRKGAFRKYVNVMIVFLVSGLWHGAGWNFIVWGGLHGLYQIAGSLLRPVRQKIGAWCHVDPDNAGNRFWRRLSTFLLVSFAWLFFRAGSLTQALQILQKAVSHWAPWQFFDGTLLKMGLNGADFIIIVVSLGILLAGSLCQYRGVDWKSKLLEQGFAFRAAVYICSILLLLIFGVWGPSYSASSFIYVDF